MEAVAPVGTAKMGAALSADFVVALLRGDSVLGVLGMALFVSPADLAGVEVIGLIHGDAVLFLRIDGL